jgi:uncharacterized membrane protein
MELYLWVKWLHIISATILFGLGLGSALLMFLAHRRKEIDGMHYAVRHVVIADWWCTTPSVIVQLITGLWMMDAGGYALHDPWIMVALVLYAWVGICWIPVVWIQIRMRDMLEQARTTQSALPPYYWKLERLWCILGGLAFPAVLVIFYLMVFKGW